MLVKEKHRVYDFSYHLVLVTKYRRPCITEEMGRFLGGEATRLVEGWGGTVAEAKADRDHMRFLLTLPPSVCISAKIGSLKNTLAKKARENFGSEVRKYLWGNSFWSDSYYMSTVGSVDAETVGNYIRKQGEPKRTYKKRIRGS